MAHVTDPYRSLYSRRTAGMSGSEIRALFAVTQRPEVISFTGGMPDMKTMPPERIQDLVSEVVGRDCASALQYTGADGIPVLREELARLMGAEGIDADPHHVVVTDGAQQALELLAKVFCDPGDVVLTEAPTYVGALSAFASYEADIRTVPTDDQGVEPEGLARVLDALREEGRPPKFLYLVPTFQNPSGVTLAPERREPVLEICRRSDVLVVEDNPYALVRFEGEPVRPLRALAEEGVIYLGTLSKVFSPGMRIGWVLAPEPVCHRLILAKEAADLCTSAFTQMVSAAYLASPESTDHLELTKKLCRERRDAMLDALERHFPPEVRTTVPSGGLFLWAELPAPLDTKAMLARALERGVAYVPGTAFYPHKPDGRRAMRLNFSYPSPEEIAEGMERLGEVITEDLELARQLEVE